MITLFMIPLILWLLPLLLPGLLGGLAGGLVVAIVNELTKVAKRFTILGERASGKTALHHFLTHGEVYLGEHKQTTIERTSKNTLRLKDLELVVKESTDIGGAEVMREQWSLLIKESDVVCYLIRGDKVFKENREYISLINKHIAQILKFKEEKQKLYLLITFLDTIPQYLENADAIKEQIYNSLSTSVFKPGTKAIYGSLKTQEDAEQLVSELIGNILEDSKK
jgi:ADP-ribosylation factor family